MPQSKCKFGKLRGGRFHIICKLGGKVIMDKIYRIGSFNLHNIGISAFTNSRNLEKIAENYKHL